MLWRRRAWRARAIAWAVRRLRERGLAITGEAEQFHIRRWSTVIRLPTNRGAVFFKATWPPQRFEAGLTAAIAKWAPDDVGRTLAIDAKRGWLLLEDAGPRLRQTITKDRDIRPAAIRGAADRDVIAHAAGPEARHSGPAHHCAREAIRAAA